MKILTIAVVVALLLYIVARADTTYVWPSEVTDEQLIVDVNESAIKYDVDVKLLWGVLYKESKFEHYRSDGKVKRGGSGEIGIAQILSDGMKIKKSHDLYDRKGNIECCAELLQHAAENDDDVLRQLGWYNSGSYIKSKYGKSVLSWINDENTVWEEAVWSAGSLEPPDSGRGVFE